MKTVSFNEASAKLFVKAYNKARQEQAEIFNFNGDEYVVDYAYYLIQHLVNNKIVAGIFNEKRIFALKPGLP